MDPAPWRYLHDNGLEGAFAVVGYLVHSGPTIKFASAIFVAIGLYGAIEVNPSLEGGCSRRIELAGAFLVATGDQTLSS